MLKNTRPIYKETYNINNNEDYDNNILLASLDTTLKIILPNVFAILVFAFLRQRTKLWSHPQGDRVNGEKLHSPFLHWPGARYSPVTSKQMSWLLK